MFKRSCLLTVSERVVTQVVAWAVGEDEEQHGATGGSVQIARILAVDGVFHADCPADVDDEQTAGARQIHDTTSEPRDERSCDRSAHQTPCGDLG